LPGNGPHLLAPGLRPPNQRLITVGGPLKRAVEL
jgi:hypothetical protein